MRIIKTIQQWNEYRLINRSGYFDPLYYLTTYPDCRRADIDPIFHYIQFGWKEGRNPSAKFNTAFYLIKNPDVAQVAINPLVHFFQHGRREGREPLPDQHSNGQQALLRTRPWDRVLNTIYTTGRKVFWRISPKYRLRVVHWAYRNLGFLFVKLPNYKDWQNSRSNAQTALQHQQNLIDIHTVKPDLFAVGSIAIHIHIFYTDLVGEFVNYLKNMPFHYDLFISIPEKEDLATYQRAFSGLPFCEAITIRSVANRGRDLAPMFCTFGAELSRHDYVAHLHSKKSLYNKGATEGWREYLCNSLFGSSDRIRRIFNLMQEKPLRGIVYPQNYIYLPYWANTWLANRELGRSWCLRLGIGDIPRGYFDYPTSSMFWARGDALAPLFQAGIELDQFPEESGQTDGTLAHCLERLFVLCTLKQKMLPGIIKDEANPSWSNWRLDQYTNRSMESIQDLLNSPNIKLIAFDIFDTLLCRPLLDPETIKSIVSRRIGGEAGHLYKQYRPIAESQARESKGSDVGMTEIYSHLGELTGLSEESLKRIRRLEEETEESSQEPRMEVVDLYMKALATGKPVVIISDMFLPRINIEKMLEKYGIQNWDEIFLSNEIGYRKDNDSLYKHVVAHYSIEPGHLLMIGDNERSDVQIPLDMGATFLHVYKPVEFARGLPRFSDLISQHEHKNDLDAEITLGLVVRKNFAPIQFLSFDPDSLVKVDPYHWGYSLVGPLLLSFAQWLYQNANKDGIHRLYFLSREGKIIKQVYDCWVEGDDKAPRSEYLVLSRRAAGVAAISSLDDILDISKTHYFPNPVEKFLFTRYGLSLPNDRWEEINRTLHMDSSSIVVVREHEFEHLRPLLKELEPDIIASAKGERIALTRYLINIGLDQDDSQAVVDIGYGGSVQGYINKLLSKKVHGYYLMTDERSEKIVNQYKVSIKSCFMGRTERPAETSIMYKSSFDLEKLLSADEPQVEFYERDNEGNLKGCFRNLTTPERECRSIKNLLLKGAMDYAHDAKQLRDTILPDFKPSTWTAEMLMDTFLVHRSNAEVDLLSKIVLDDHYCGRELVY